MSTLRDIQCDYRRGFSIFVTDLSTEALVKAEKLFQRLFFIGTIGALVGALSSIISVQRASFNVEFGSAIDVVGIQLRIEKGI